MAVGRIAELPGCFLSHPVMQPSHAASPPTHSVCTPGFMEPGRVHETLHPGDLSVTDFSTDLSLDPAQQRAGRADSSRDCVLGSGAAVMLAIQDCTTLQQLTRIVQRQQLNPVHISAILSKLARLAPAQRDHQPPVLGRPAWPQQAVQRSLQAGLSTPRTSLLHQLEQLILCRLPPRLLTPLEPAAQGAAAALPPTSPPHTHGPPWTPHLRQHEAMQLSPPPPQAPPHPIHPSWLPPPALPPGLHDMRNIQATQHATPPANTRLGQSIPPYSWHMQPRQLATVAHSFAKLGHLPQPGWLPAFLSCTQHLLQLHTLRLRGGQGHCPAACFTSQELAMLAWGVARMQKLAAGRQSQGGQQHPSPQRTPPSPATHPLQQQQQHAAAQAALARTLAPAQVLTADLTAGDGLGGNMLPTPPLLGPAAAGMPAPTSACMSTAPRMDKCGGGGAVNRRTLWGGAPPLGTAAGVLRQGSPPLAGPTDSRSSQTASRRPGALEAVVGGAAGAQSGVGGPDWDGLPGGQWVAALCDACLALLEAAEGLGPMPGLAAAAAAAPPYLTSPRAPSPALASLSLQSAAAGGTAVAPTSAPAYPSAPLPLPQRLLPAQPLLHGAGTSPEQPTAAAAAAPAFPPAPPLLLPPPTYPQQQLPLGWGAGPTPSPRRWEGRPLPAPAQPEPDPPHLRPLPWPQQHGDEGAAPAPAAVPAGPSSRLALQPCPPSLEPDLLSTTRPQLDLGPLWVSHPAPAAPTPTAPPTSAPGPSPPSTAVLHAASPLAPNRFSPAPTHHPAPVRHPAPTRPPPPCPPSAQDQVMVVWALGVLGYPPPPRFLQVWVGAALAGVGRLQGRDLAQLMGALAALRWRPHPALMAALTTRAIRLAERGGLALRDASELVCSMASLRYDPGPALIAAILRPFELASQAAPPAPWPARAHDLGAADPTQPDPHRGQGAVQWQQQHREQQHWHQQHQHQDQQHQDQQQQQQQLQCQVLRCRPLLRARWRGSRLRLTCSWTCAYCCCQAPCQTPQPGTGNPRDWQPSRPAHPRRTPPRPRPCRSRGCGVNLNSRAPHSHRYQPHRHSVSSPSPQAVSAAAAAAAAAATAAEAAAYRRLSPSARDACSLVWALGVLRRRPSPHALHGLMRSALAQRQWKDQDLAQLVWGATRLRFPALLPVSAALLRALSTALAARSLGPVSLPQLLWGLAVGRYPLPPPLAARLFHVAVIQAKRLTPQGAVLALYFAVKAQVSPPPGEVQHLLRAVARAILRYPCRARLAPSPAPSPSPQDSSYPIPSPDPGPCPGHHPHPSPDPDPDPDTHAGPGPSPGPSPGSSPGAAGSAMLTSLPGGQPLPALLLTPPQPPHPGVVAAGINAAAQAAGAGQGKLATGMAGSGARGIGMSAGFSGARPEVQGHTVSLLFWALAQLRYCPPALLTRQLLQHTQELAASMSGRECSALAWALARLGVRPPAAWLLLFRARVRQLAAEEQLTGTQADSLVSALARVRPASGREGSGLQGPALSSAGTHPSRQH